MVSQMKTMIEKRETGFMLKTLWMLLVALTLHSYSFAAALEKDTLVVTYVTAHLNKYDDAVRGVLVTPKGETLNTKALSGYSADRIVLSDLEIGTYQVYYEALQSIQPRMCFIVGGIEVTLCNQPHKQLEFTPKTSRIQTFKQDTAIKPGVTTNPIGTFEITAEDLGRLL